jgi:hypothetical protein
MRWCYHHSKLSDERGKLQFRVGWFRRKLPVEFRLHHTSYLSHILLAVNMKSQFDVYLTSRKTQLNITRYIRAKLNWEFQIFGSTEHVRFTLKKHTWLNAGNAFIELSSKYISFPLYRNPKQKKYKQCAYNVKFRRIFVTIFPVKSNEYYILGACVCRLRYTA